MHNASRLEFRSSHFLEHWGSNSHQKADWFTASRQARRFVGRLVKEKGLLELAEAVSGMEGVKVVFVGKGPSQRSWPNGRENPLYSGAGAE